MREFYEYDTDRWRQHYRAVDGQAEIRVLDEYYLHASEGNVVDLALEAADQRLKVPLSILMISRSGRIRTR